jgi:hypothetical protein
MKHILSMLAALALAASLSSCGFSMATISGNNINNTQVQLGSNNFKYVDHVSGSADVSYILMIGGLSKNQLYENAYAAMMSKAKLADGSRAIANVVTEEHVGGVPPIFFTRTITVSANVIEFTR